MWAVGVVDLGLSPAVFWDLTPYEFHLLERRFIAQERRLDERAALIARYVANYAGRMLPDGKQISNADVLGYSVQQDSDLEKFRRQAQDPLGDYLRKLQAADPDSQIAVAKAVTDACAAGLGEWGKLGPEARLQPELLQPVRIMEVMAGRKPN
jgi:hypothetical protein